MKKEKKKPSIYDLIHDITIKSYSCIGKLIQNLNNHPIKNETSRLNYLGIKRNTLDYLTYQIKKLTDDVEKEIKQEQEKSK